MRILPWLIPALAVALACSESSPVAPVATATSGAAPTAVAADTRPTAPSISPTAAPAPTVAADTESARSDSGLDSLSQEAQEARDQLGTGTGLHPYTGLATLEEIILKSDTIVRATYLSSTSSVALTSDGHDWHARLEFRFEVHEYLKGSGPNEIDGIVTAYFNTEAHAEWAKPLIVQAHDSRWDNRQAILFLNYRSVDVSPLRWERANTGLGAWVGPTQATGTSTPWRASWAKTWLPEVRQITSKVD